MSAISHTFQLIDDFANDTRLFVAFQELPFLFILLSFGLSASLVSSFDVEGAVSMPPAAPSDWMIEARVFVTEGEKRLMGFIRADGSFRVHNVPTGSYVVEVMHPRFVFESVRLDIISGKGRVRARKLNLLLSNAVKTIPYPLQLSSAGQARYFTPREQLRTMDLLLNGNVLLMVAPLVLVFIMVKVMNSQDPELQKEVQQQMNMFNAKQNVPEVSELLSNWFGSGAGGAGGSSSRRAVTSGAGGSTAARQKLKRK